MIAASFVSPVLESGDSKAKLVRRIKCALAVLLALGAFIATLVLGWGCGDLLELFSHPARATALGLLMMELAFAVAQTRPLQPLRGQSPALPARVLFWTVALAFLFVAASSSFWDRRILFVLPGGDVTRYAGLGICMAGLAVNAWWRRASANEFDDRRLRTTSVRLRAGDPWRHVGIVLVVIGIPLVFLSEIGLLGGFGVSALAIVRAVWKLRCASAAEGVGALELKAA